MDTSIKTQIIAPSSHNGSLNSNYHILGNKIHTFGYNQFPNGVAKNPISKLGATLSNA